MSQLKLEDHAPQLGAGAWIADSADVIGRVTLGARSSVWFQSVIRGDQDHISVGEETNVQDASVLHTDQGIPLNIGARVTIGHQVMLHGCDIGDESLIGIGSVILNGAQIGRHCLVGARALVTEGKSFPDGSLILGTPAKVVRQLTAEEIAGLQASAMHYVENARRFHSALREVSD